MHRRRRTALTVSAVLLLGAPILTACGNEAHPGAAAVVGGGRIEVATLQTRMKDVREAQSGSPDSAQLVNKSGQLARATLHGLIFGEILDRASDDAGVTVSRKEIQDMRESAAKQYGGEEGLRATMLQQRWVAPDQIDSDLRKDVQLPKLAAALGADLETPTGQQKVTQALADASRALHIDVNPRYGAWDEKKIQLGGYSAPWISQVTTFGQEAPQTGG
ncbi:SurA N-terminal domain-containing protein [uncultured Streptomyces sp.]|uniref:SurA N-terminal domain-containing protein n=1 Tax=uncultured Streptomyces sp. TaxID=174707 RepID=UPI00262D5FEA|nr:SurA N-terminal domain-containing protein [uncultured Streptomyces sp.]